ncbi:MAG: DNA primase [Desulfonatronovibrionaceae bacterium]
MGGPSTIEEVKTKVDLVEVVSRYVELRQAGERWIGVCPFHQETKGSFSVNPELGFFYCFGCQAGGDVIEFYRRINGLEFKEALEQLAREAGVSTGARTGQSAQRKRKKTLFLEMHDLAKHYFCSRLKGREGESARNYLRKRGVSADLEESFCLGWSPEQWHGLENFLLSKGYTRELGLESGLLGQGRKGTVFDRFRGRLIFPIISLSGHCVAFGARAIDGGEPKYLNSRESEIYTKGEHLYGLSRARTSVSQKKEVFLTEGYLDVIALHQFGFTHSCGVLGTALTSGQVKRLGNLVRRVVLVFDGDGAGRKAALRSAEMILGQGLECLVVDLPEGEDVDSFLRENGKEALEGLKKKSLRGLDFCLRELNRDYSPRETMHWAKGFLNRLQDVTWRAYYIPRLAAELGLAEKEFRQAVEKDAAAKNPQTARDADRGTSGGCGLRDKEILSILLCFPEFKTEFRDSDMELCLVNSWARNLWQKIQNRQESEFLPFLDEQERAFYYQSQQRREELASRREDLRRQLRIFLRSKEDKTARQYLRKALARAEKEGDREEVKRILRLLQENMHKNQDAGYFSA